MNVPAKFEVHSFTRSWDNSGYLKTLGSPWIRPRSLFSKIVMGFCSAGPCEVWMYWPNLTSVALPVPEIIAIEFLGAGCEPQSWGRGGRRGRRRYRLKERWWVTFPLSLRVSEILPLSCFSTPLFPAPPLVSPKFKFPHVPLGVGEERRCWANCPCN